MSVLYFPSVCTTQIKFNFIIKNTRYLKTCSKKNIYWFSISRNERRNVEIQQQINMKKKCNEMIIIFLFFWVKWRTIKEALHVAVWNGFSVDFWIWYFIGYSPLGSFLLPKRIIEISTVITPSSFLPSIWQLRGFEVMLPI